MQELSSDLKQFFLVKNSSSSVHSDTDDAEDYNRVIGIALLKAFSCANKNVWIILPNRRRVKLWC